MTLDNKMIFNKLVLKKTESELIIRTIKSEISKSGLNLNKLVIYASADIAKSIEDKVIWAVRKGEKVGNVVVDYDYGIIMIDDVRVPIVISYIPMDDINIKIFSLDDLTYDFAKNDI